MHKTILITGGAGFIGSQIARKMLLDKYHVVIVDNLSTGKKSNIPTSATFFKTDIKDQKAIKDLIEQVKPDVISHNAAQVQVRHSVDFPQEDAETNILGTLNLLQAVKKFPQTHFVFSSSGGAIYGESHQKPNTENFVLEPHSPYGISKFAAEKYIQMYNDLFGLKTTILRYANVYGPYQSPFEGVGVISLFINQLLHEKRPTILGDGSSSRDYVFVEDVVNANVEVIQQQINGIFNIGTGRKTTTLDLFEMIAKQMKSTIRPIFAAPRLGEVQENCLNVNKALQTFGWKPQTDLIQGIQKTIDWLKQGEYEQLYPLD